MKQYQKIETNIENGLNETLRQMFLLEQTSLRNPDFVAWVKKQFANNCLACIPGLIWSYVRQNFKYKSDDFDEVIRAPHILLQEKQGDCDDFALFIKTCLDIIGGWNSEYVILGKKLNQYTHIIVFANRGVCGVNYIDPVKIDGVNSKFDSVPSEYKFYKRIIFK